MTKSVTVNFDDGTSHTYDNVPDDVTDDQVEARAGTDFGDKTIAGVGGSASTPLDTGLGTNNPEATTGQKAIAAGQTAITLANEFLGSPLGHAAEAYAGYRGIAKPLLEKYLGAKQAVATPSPAEAAGRAVGNLVGGPTAAGDAWASKVTGSMGPGGESVTEAARNYQMQKGLSPAEAAKYSVNRGGIIVPNQAPVAAPAPAPTVGGPAAQEGASFIERMTQKFAPMAQKVAPILNNPIVNNPVTRFAASAPVQGAIMALTPSSTGPAVPSRGPARGSELNPATRRPWTAEELRRYHAQY